MLDAPPTPPQIVSAVFDSVTRTLTVGFDQAMNQNPLIDPTRWMVRTGTDNRYGDSVAWLDAVTVRFDTAQQMGMVTPIEGVYSGESSLPNVQSLAGGGVPLADQVFALVVF